VTFYLQSAAPVLRTDIILITSVGWAKVIITPSRTALTYNQGLEAYEAEGAVTNLTEKPFKGRIQGKLELINTFKTIALVTQCRTELLSALKDYPMGKEVFSAPDKECEGLIKRVLPAVNQISTPCKEDVYVSDLELADTVIKNQPDSELDLSDTLMNREPTYSGTARIDSDVIDAHGVDLPTVIYKDAKEAIDLQKYSAELRPFIKDIFIDKYPNAVSLHALDAGNFSLTLGYTQLRLREGEVLPRAKRIFQISPLEARHLEDICDFLIKYGYIRRAPITPTGHHLYGVSSYLIPRAKAGCLGRLIVDFSPINALIESPPNVIPEVFATLQFLQGKALYTGLDLRLTKKVKP
jgi:hypothetical protein